MTDLAMGVAPAAQPRRLRAALSFRNVSALYIFAFLFVLFALWVPDTFLTAGVWRSLLANSALTALVAIAVTIPLAAGTFNLAVGTEVGMAAIVSAWLLESFHLSVVPTLVLTLLAGCAIGGVSGALIVRARIDSFIATLGMSSVLLALVAWISGGQQILNLPGSFQSLATNELLGLAYPVWIMLAVGLVVWYVLQRTPTGRRVYATGGNVSAARLAGVRTSRVIVLSLVSCGAIAALAGLLTSAQLAVGDPTVGPGYLLPAYAAAFLGSTQFHGGRYNVWGAVIAVLVLAVGVKGLQLAGAPVWIPDLFNGVALLLAVGLSKYQRTARRSAAVARLLRRGEPRS
ncbi:ABC transporter permease [Solirubrobacter ginsenosidimutans]|uniref:ABC transporter permease n=1 Tax=Solirubrobacter ginsenosidimutans TaxID=490573 RepID=A0A9X3N8M2_9ACTN|nr:ABC transporter permease [Solirubrobacter ginsenosidimutans]MDA0166853.1 ABC transporter permease [Solirubrobacter ginsenosidimutans]